jgi:hypothetical protein
MVRVQHQLRAGLLACTAIAALSACGSDSDTAQVDTSTAHGTLVQNPPFRITSLDAATFQANLASASGGAQLLELAGDPTCGVDFYTLDFETVGAAGEATESSGALMVPTGSAAGCSGPRPIVLYAHGTQTEKSFNISDITNPSNTEGALIAAMFAAHGFIVVAPNYAGYDISTLGYHPFVNAVQQSGEMLDILTAARSALPAALTPGTSDSGTLFVTGYSEGGFVAMATLRALQASGTAVTAAAPMSGPYALEAFADAIFFGQVDLDSTVFAPLLTTSYQHAYGNIYSATTDIYSATYAANIATVLPSTLPVAEIFENGLLPPTALFDSSTPTVSIANNAAESSILTAELAPPPLPPPAQNAIFDLGFGSGYLINNSFRVSYAEDAFADPDGAVPVNPLITSTPTAALAPSPPMLPFRLALYKNDLRNGTGFPGNTWAPEVPTLLCGGSQDPTVFFSLNTGTMKAFWPAQVMAGLITVLDVDPQNEAAESPPQEFGLIQAAFQSTDPDAPANIPNYHTNVAPFCTLAARAFFDQVLGG